MNKSAIKPIEIPIVSVKDILDKERLKKKIPEIEEELISLRTDTLYRLVNDFEEKTSTCKIEGIKGDVLQIEYTIRDISRELKGVKEVEVAKRFYDTLSRYDTIYKKFETECECKKK